MRITIRQKLYGGFSAVLLFLIIISISNYMLSSKISNEYAKLIDNDTAVVSYIKDLNNEISDEQVSVNYYLLTGDSKYFKSYQNAFDTYNEKSKKVSELINGQDSWQVLQGLDLIQEQYIIAADQMIEYKKKNNIDKYTQIAKDQGVLIQKFRDTSGKFISNQEEILNEEINHVNSMVSSAKIILSIFTLIIILFGFGIAYGISNLISKPIVLLSKVAAKISTGDLTAEEIQINRRSNDEISELVTAFNKMTNNLRKLLIEVGMAASQVASSAEELTTGAEETAKVTEYVANITQDLANGTERQVISVHESVESVHRISEEVVQIETRTQSANEQVLRTTGVVLEGNTAVQKAIEQMNSVENIVIDIANTVDELGEQSNKINQIIALITNIATQTNLLALNASIEAARAGEAGKGFAVVAAEVSKLAEQTAASGKQVSEVIKTILDKTEKTVSIVSKGKKEVDDGIEAVRAAGVSFDIIQNSINEFKYTIEEVSRVSKHMSDGTEQLVIALDTIEGVSKTAADGTQNVSASTEEQLATMEGITNSASALNKMSDDLINLISTFKVDNI